MFNLLIYPLITKKNNKMDYNPPVTETDLNSIGMEYVAQYGRTPVCDLFFHPENILFLKTQLENMLQNMTQEKHPIKVEITSEFCLTMYNVCSQNPSLAYSGFEGLKALNRMFLEWEGRIQYLSLRQHKLYEKWFIRNDRIRVMPYGSMEKVTRGEVVITPSAYTLTSPWNRHRDQYMADIFQPDTRSSYTSYSAPITYGRP